VLNMVRAQGFSKSLFRNLDFTPRICTRKISNHPNMILRDIPGSASRVDPSDTRRQSESYPPPRLKARHHQPNLSCPYNQSPPHPHPPVPSHLTSIATRLSLTAQRVVRNATTTLCGCIPRLARSRPCLLLSITTTSLGRSI